MATRGEPDHVWFVLQALHANHPRCAYLVIDNTPERDPRVEAVTRAVGGTYIHRPDLTGTSAPRDAVFRFANTPWAMCIDSHVILETGAIQAALDFIAQNPESKDIVTGPILWDNGAVGATHWKPVSDKALWGAWATDERIKDVSLEIWEAKDPWWGTPTRFTPVEINNEIHATEPGKGTGTASPKFGPFATMPADARKISGGDGEPFEIPMMGLGLWMMRCAAWPGFNPLFRGFGGEEGYIHEVVRRNGGKALCLPALKWRHKFRDTSGWHNNPPPPYPLNAGDHTHNLLVGHRELGINADAEIRAHHGRGWSDEAWAKAVAEADAKQPFGGPRQGPKRQKLLVVWYSDNTAPARLLQSSAMSVVAAKQQTLRHDVDVSAVSWEQIPGAPFGEGRYDREPKGVTWNRFSGERKRSHGTIVKQIQEAVQRANAHWNWHLKSSTDGLEWNIVNNYDAVVFCEHDVLYPPGYFDRIGDAIARNPDAPVVSHLDYIGLNGTGWQRVKDRHEPLHQLALRWDTFQANIARAEKEAIGGAQVVLEPDHGGDRSAWVRISSNDLSGMSGTPSVHVNHNAGRFTGHGDVCYEPRGVSLWHAHWGEARRWWPGEMETVSNIPTNQFKGAAPVKIAAVPKGGCSACEANAHQTPEQWATESANKESDFHEHVPTLRELAGKCSSATEMSAWMKPADAAIVSGLPKDATFTSVCHYRKPQWAKIRSWMGERFTELEQDPATVEDIKPVDMLFIDTHHTAQDLYPLLEKHAPSVNKYLVVHCTETYGEHGDKPQTAGVLHALRTFCLKNPEWVVKRRDRNNHGLMVLSKCAEDVREKPSLFRQAVNFTTAMAKHVSGGRKTVPLEVLSAREAECAICEFRALDACSACGCPLEAKLPLSSEKCPKDKWLAHNPSSLT
jgi:hypothetical protein